MIALDANGADRGPAVVAQGAARAGVSVLVFGPAAELDGYRDPGSDAAGARGRSAQQSGGALAGQTVPVVEAPEARPAGETVHVVDAPEAVPAGRTGNLDDAPGALPAGQTVHVVDAPEAIPAGEEPVRAVRSRPQASIVQAAAAVADGRADALVSAGSTGPTLAAATLQIKRLRGVHRPALAVLLPVPAGPVLLLDCGANVEVRPEHLEQFAYMGASFMEAVYGIDRPRVGLLSVGEEQGKGTPDVLAAHERLAGGTLDFVGNVEGFDLPRAGADVIVTDGFTGNVALKVMEGTSKEVTGAIRAAIRSNVVSTLGGLLIRGQLGRLRAKLDPEAVGGAILLGLRKPVVVAHGSFGPDGIASAVRLAQRAVDEDMTGRTAAALQAAGAMRSAPVGSVAAP